MKKLLLLTGVFLAACQSSNAEPAGPEATEVIKEAAQGAKIFETNCAACHGADMSGGQAESLLDDVWVYGGTDKDILRSIGAGIEEAGMPAFGSSINPEDQASLLAYIRNGKSLSVTPAIKTVPTITQELNLEDWVSDLEQPWGLAFTGENDALITQKGGALRVVRGGELLSEPVKGTPEVLDNGQGGLLDVALDPDYAENEWVYLTFSHPIKPGGKAAMTKLVRGKIIGNQWTQEQTLFAAKPEHYVKSRVHYGSRITFDKAGHLYFSIGDRGQKDMAQDISKPNGKIHRINRDGSIPSSNPFADDPNAYPSIYAYGNRNPQGLIVHPSTDVLWETEHGPKGGDELNVIKKGVNYGWPKISYGRNYSGTDLTPYTSLPGMAQPASHWTPSIAVCGLDVYTGNLFPEWTGRLMAGSLKNETVRLVKIDNQTYVSEEILIEDQGRIRDVTTGPDGAIYVAVETKIIRISPK